MIGETPSEYLYDRTGNRVRRRDVVVRTAVTQARSSRRPGSVPRARPQPAARSVKTMEQRMEIPLWPTRAAAGFLGICGSSR